MAEEATQTYQLTETDAAVRAGQYYLNKRLDALQVSPNEDDWLKKMSKVSPVLQGIGGVANLAMGIVRSRQEPGFQAELLGALKTMEADRGAIKEQINKIYDQLQKIESAIAGLGLIEKLTAITTWAGMMMAIDPEDTAGMGRLAAAMLNPRHGISSLPGCMNDLHDALVGNNIGTPLMELVGPLGFLRIRARLMQGVHLLAFASACHREAKVDFGVYWLNWARNFEEQNRKYFALLQERIPEADFAGQGTLQTADHAVIYELSCPVQEGVALVMKGKDRQMAVFSGDLASSIPQGFSRPMIGFPHAPRVAFVDLALDRCSTNPAEPWVAECNPWMGDTNRWCWVTMEVISGLTVEKVAERVKLAAAARYHPAQTFLGAVDGQLAWLEATGERSTYTCCLHDGAEKTSPLLRWEEDGESVAQISKDALQSLSPTLWSVSQISKDVIRIARLSASERPAYLTLRNGAWAMTEDQQQSNLRIEVPEAEAQPIPKNPLTLAPVFAQLSRDGSGAKTVLFHRM